MAGMTDKEGSRNNDCIVAQLHISAPGMSEA